MFTRTLSTVFGYISIGCIYIKKSTIFWPEYITDRPSHYDLPYRLGCTDLCHFTLATSCTVLIRPFLITSTHIAIVFLFNLLRRHGQYLLRSGLILLNQSNPETEHYEPAQTRNRQAHREWHDISRSVDLAEELLSAYELAKSLH